MKFFRTILSLNSQQRGLSLLEILIAVAVSGVIASSVVLIIFNIVDNNRRSLDHMTAVKEVENAVHWLMRDGQMAQTVTTTSPPPAGSGFPLALTYTDSDNVAHNVTYSVENDQLKRTDSVEGTSVIVRSINSSASLTNCEATSSVINFEITATVGTGEPQSETRSFQVLLRSSERY